MATKDPEQQQIIGLVKKSNEISSRLEEGLFEIWPLIVDRAKNIDILIASFDLENGLSMAPVTNLGSTYLKRFIGDTLLLYFLRNELAFTDIRPEAPSTARWLLNYLKQRHGDHDRDSVICLARIAPSPESNALAINLARTPAAKVTVAIPDEAKGVATSVLEMADDLSKQRKNVDLVVSSFSVKLDETTVIPFAYLGLWAVPSQLKPEEVDKEYSSLLRSIHFSRMATLSILLERQRYFEKSVRQSVSGYIIKYGERKDIESQTDMFINLHSKNTYIVPSVIDREFVDQDNAWYLMPKYTPPSLMNLFSRTDGFEKFEIESIVISAFKCLTEQLYSEDPIVLESVKTRDFLYGPAAMAGAAMQDCLQQIGNLGVKIDSGKPVKLGRNIEVFPKDYFKHLRAYIQIVAKIRDQSGRVSCATPGSIVRSTIGQNLLSFDGIKDDISQIPSLDRVRRVKTRDGRIHGDAHFGNFLIDASIPEAPLIYLIDTRDVPFGKELTPDVESLVPDPLYDFALMLLSCSCGYDLANRNGFLIAHIQPDECRIDLEYSCEPILEKQHDTSGVSRTQIVHLESGISSQAHDNYRDACKALCGITKSWLGRFLQDDRAYAVSLVKIWLLTVHHAFSMARDLFPKYPGRSLAMLGLAMIFVNNGKDCVGNVLKSLRSKDPVHAQCVACLERGLQCVLSELV